MTELDERKAAVLRAIVEQYVDTAQPVGSQTVTSTTGLGVSAATVRNEMSLLEREGYIAQPHPSAGPGAHRPRLPLLRRPSRRRGPAARDRAPPHRRVLQQRHARHGPAPRPDEPAARAGDLARRRRRRARAAGRRRPRREPRVAAAAGRARGGGAVERLGGEGRRRVRPRPRRRRRRRRQRALRP